eukprot:Rhum_TRINITY_DN8382_c0_g1::Rhum_TRINITY_DN8382_c0_g1_i1::g.27553::m.27553
MEPLTPVEAVRCTPPTDISAAVADMSVEEFERIAAALVAEPPLLSAAAAAVTPEAVGAAYAHGAAAARAPKHQQLCQAADAVLRLDRESSERATLVNAHIGDGVREEVTGRMRRVYADSQKMPQNGAAAAV